MTEQVDLNWQFVRDWLVRELMIDDEWLLDGTNEFTWWPWLLAQRIAVSNEAVLVDGSRQDQMIRVTATTDVLTNDNEALSTAFVQNVNEFFPFGAWVWRDGKISLTSSLALNPLCLDLLPQFRDACLVQTSNAHLVLRQVWDEFGEQALASEHPVSGLRQAPDDLLSLYANGEFQLDVSPDFRPALAAARQTCADALADLGIARTLTDDDMDVYDFAGRTVVLTQETDSSTATAFGPGLAVVTLVVPPGQVLAPETLNAANLTLAASHRSSHLGVMMSNAGAMQHGSPIRTVLGYPYLSRMMNDVDGMGISILNAISHAVSAATELDTALRTM